MNISKLKAEVCLLIKKSLIYINIAILSLDNHHIHLYKTLKSAFTIVETLFMIFSLSGHRCAVSNQ